MILNLSQDDGKVLLAVLVNLLLKEAAAMLVFRYGKNLTLERLKRHICKAIVIRETAAFFDYVREGIRKKLWDVPSGF
jgi:hypothetical protein